MPFGPTNAPPFYTAMMKDFKDEWDTLFIIHICEIKTHRGLAIVKTPTDDIMTGDKKIIWTSKTIIDDMFLWCDTREFILTLFTCVCEVFQKYWVSFILDKYECLKSRVEYVGHDILHTGNPPAQFRSSLLTDWPLPTLGQSLFSFIDLVNFYHRYTPYMKMRLKPLRSLVKLFYREPIPSTA